MNDCTMYSMKSWKKTARPLQMHLWWMNGKISWVSHHWLTVQNTYCLEFNKWILFKKSFLIIKAVLHATYWIQSRWSMQLSYSFVHGSRRFLFSRHLYWEKTYMLLQKLKKQNLMSSVSSSMMSMFLIGHFRIHKAPLNCEMDNGQGCTFVALSEYRQ